MPETVLFDRYRLIEPAGRGGSAEVWRRSVADRPSDRRPLPADTPGQGDKGNGRGKATGRAADPRRMT